MPAVVFDLPPGIGPYQSAPPTYEWPFLGNGDSTSFILTRSYKQRIAGYNADRLAASYLPGVAQDVAHNDAYMIAESPASRSLSALAVFNRVFARVPLQQVNPSSIFVTKPPITGTLPQRIGDALVVQPVATEASYDGYAAQTVLADSGAPSPYPTGGTYTLTYGANTTAAIAFNASAATVSTAINLLASITNMGGVTVSGSYNSAGGLLVKFANYAVGTVTASSLTASTGTPTFTGTMTTLYPNGRLVLVNIQKNDGTVSYINGGTYTLTIFGQTTAAITFVPGNPNSNKTNIETALNALSTVSARGGITCGYNPGNPSPGIDYSILFYIGFPGDSGTSQILITAAAGSIIPAPATIAVASAVSDPLNGNVTQSIKFTSATSSRIISVPAHGLTAADTFYIKADGSYYSELTGLVIADANTLSVPVTPASAYLSAVAITEIGKRTKTDYTPGIALIRCKRVTDFYLPGVSPGIATSDDVPLPTFQGDPASLLAAIFTGSTEINYEVGELSRWREGPILQRTTTTINATRL